MTAPRLEVSAVSKTFGSTQVLSDSHMTIQPGEVHGLVGQNGSGKSTLIKILTGYHRPDPGGEVKVDGESLRLPVRWGEAHAAGVAVVHQDLGLLDHLTVAENICVGSYPTNRHTGRIDFKERDRVAARVLERLEVAIEPRVECGALNQSQRAEVAIARALRDQAPGSGLTILDESTRALSGHALEAFHELLRRVAAAGGAILMVSHNLPEILAITDRVSVLRDGEVAGAGLLTRELTEAALATRMLGRALAGRPVSTKAREAGTGGSVRIDRLSSAELSEVSFTVEAGAVVGITGLPGTGFEVLPYLLGGRIPAASGHLRIGRHELDLRKGDVRASLRAGVVLVPERRDRDGLAFSMSAGENLALPLLRKRGRAWLVKRGWQKREFEQAVRELDIRPPNPARLIKELSGGNQQKVLLAKWLATGPSLMILHEPTQAVDVAARQDILNAVRRAADEDGVPVILVTEEADDLAKICDRVLVHRPGSPLRELTEFDSDAIILAIYGEASVAAGHNGEGVPTQEGERQ